MPTFPDRRSFEARAYDGWALQSAARLEAACPGFLVRTLYASSLKRQALFAALADLDEQSPIVEVTRDGCGRSAKASVVVVQDLFDTLTNVDAERMIAAIFGSCPRSYLILLAQLGAAPVASRTFYRTAFELCVRADGATGA